MPSRRGIPFILRWKAIELINTLNLFTDLTSRVNGVSTEITYGLQPRIFNRNGPEP